MNTQYFWALSLLLSCGLCQAESLESQWELAIAAAHGFTSDSALFETNSNLSRQALLQGALHYGTWEGQVSVIHKAKRGGSEDTLLVVEELFWQREWLGWDWLLGKRRLDFGVGYGYRPLDWFLPVERNPVSLQANEGVAVISASRFTESGELSIMWVDANAGQEAENELPKGLAVRWYQLEASAEWQFLGYLDDQRGINLGASWVNTYGEQWELHGEWRYQQEYLYWQEPQSPELASAPKQIELDNGWLALMGMTWANSRGHSVILEYWFDSRAWGHKNWSTLRDNSQWYQSRGALWDGLRLSSAQAYLSENALQHTMLVHWGLSNHEYHPKVDLIYTPEDGGIIFTAGFSCEVGSDWTVAASVRYFDGPEESASAQLPNQAVVTLSSSIVF
ncbi:hypothetical protein MO867_20240 [Microbulbifer sp. OS29]|uniref:Beta-barrel porin-2, OmpL-like. bbp2 n=1 Tax=Microbulbifer okhotskensis TaxID=2926617 RepID=A0A9X2J7J3_9GAMM|nr:hypothetical protein [Microbulbifer okhotskensis]MCO1336659.1 hypothetical protein [Microbulbifer okhotskensis]